MVDLEQLDGNASLHGGKLIDVDAAVATIGLRVDAEGPPLVVEFLVFIALFLGEHPGLAGQPGALDHLSGEVSRRGVGRSVQMMIGVEYAIGEDLLKICDVDTARSELRGLSQRALHEFIMIGRFKLSLTPGDVGTLPSPSRPTCYPAAGRTRRLHPYAGLPGAIRAAVRNAPVHTGIPLSMAIGSGPGGSSGKVW
ncbi:hypothetical protein [Frankia sp. EAN1pec]|uniref:hypothetical protein n=1 Tax=Parafrankia sp. (strain EAN1pec) TaxID=298653 RepID=UPI0012F9265A